MKAGRRPASVGDPPHAGSSSRHVRVKAKSHEDLRPLIVPVFLPHAGCPHRCVFCNQVRITGVSAALPEPEEIKRCIEAFLGFTRTPRRRIEIAFYGGTFLGLPASQCRRLLSTAEKFIADGRAHGIRFSTRPDTICEETVTGLRRFSIAAVEIGAQSMDDAVLRACRRGHTALDTVRAVQTLREHDLSVGLQIMIGLPGEDESSRRLTTDEIIALSPDFVRIYPTVVLPGSELSRWYRMGTYTPLTLEAAVESAKQIFLRLQAHHIPVIRMGLQSSPALEGDGGVPVGPYHPAFGHLVLSEIAYDIIARKLAQAAPQDGILHLRVHPGSLSQVQGLKKNNLNRLKQRFGLRDIVLSTDPCLKKMEVRFSSNEVHIPESTGS